MEGSPPTRDPYSLWAASLDRLESAAVLIREGRDLAGGVYLAGLAVETLLQALTHLSQQPHDARHSLNHWLTKCSTTLQDSLAIEPALSQWSLLSRVWRNDLR